MLFSCPHTACFSQSLALWSLWALAHLSRVLMAVFLFLCIFLHLCSPLSPSLGPSVSSPHQGLSAPWAPEPWAAWAGRWHGVVGGGGPGGGPFIQCSSFFSSAFSSQGPPAPTNTISPSSAPLPPCSQPASLPPSCPPSSLPPSLHLSPPPPPPSHPPLLGRSRTQRGRAGRRRRPRRGEGAVVAAVVAAAARREARLGTRSRQRLPLKGDQSRRPGPPTESGPAPGHPTLLRLPVPPASLHPLLPPHLSTSSAPLLGLTRVASYPVLASPFIDQPLLAQACFSRGH